MILNGESSHVKLHGRHFESLICCIRVGNAGILVLRRNMNSSQIARKLQAFAALFALLLSAAPLLAASLSALDLSACCTTSYCPVHHRQARDLQKDKNNCDAQGRSAGNDCALRACDTPPNPAVATALLVLMAPPAISYRVVAEPAPVLVSAFFPFHLNLPTTPPPRTLPS